MIINSFHPGMIIESQFLMPDGTAARTLLKRCVVMSVHVKGILVHPVIPRGSSAEAFAVYTKQGRVACDLRNIIESPSAYAVAQTLNNGVSNYAKAVLDAQDFAALRERSLDCAYHGPMKSARLGAPSGARDRQRLA